MSLVVVLRIVFGFLFAASLVGGYFLFKHMDTLLKHPSENRGSSGLNKVQLIAIWLHVVALTGGFLFLLH
ncbi:MAG TPA: hypothetical protein VF607_00960 [Verrucomicrobiae bacterium]